MYLFSILSHLVIQAKSIDNQHNRRYNQRIGVALQGNL